MRKSRRLFLKQSSSLAIGLSLVGSACTTGEVEDIVTSTIAKSPKSGLLFGPEDLDRLRANIANPRFGKALREMSTMDEADIISVDEEIEFLENELRTTNHVVHMLRARATLERSALIYRLKGDPDQLRLAKVALRRICDYPKWDYFLEGGVTTIGLQRAAEATIAVLLALDWLGDSLTDEERERAELNVIEKGAPACYTTLYGLKYPDRVKGWTIDPEDEYPISYDLSRWPLILNSTNLKIVPTSALGLAGCYFNGSHSEADKWLQMARSSARSFAEMFHPDGAYDEGVGYWSYSISHLALFAEVQWRTLGIDDRSLINYRGSLEFAICQSMPTLGEPYTLEKRRITTPNSTINPADDMVNFGDSGLGLDVKVAPWIARVHHDKLAQYMAEEVGAIKSLWGAIWYHPGLPSAPPSKDLFDRKFDNDIVVSRSGWDAADSVVAFKSGGPGNHEHSDRNSVIFKSHGERLFHDPFRAGYDADGERWKLRQTDAHTAVLVNGKGHQYHDGSEGVNSSWSWARVTAYEATGGWMTVTSDATEAYQLVDEDIDLVERSLVYIKPDILIILDRVKMKSMPATVQTRYQVYNDDEAGAAVVAGDSFEINRPHAHLRGVVNGSQEIIVRFDRIGIAEDEGIFPYVEVESATALEHVVISASCASPGSDTLGTLAITKVDDTSWRVSGTHRGQTIDVELTVVDGALDTTVSVS